MSKTEEVYITKTGNITKSIEVWPAENNEEYTIEEYEGFIKLSDGNYVYAIARGEYDQNGNNCGYDCVVRTLDGDFQRIDNRMMIDDEIPLDMEIFEGLAEQFAMEQFNYMQSILQG